MNDFEPFRFTLGEELTMLLRLLVAGVAGGFVGWERKYFGHHAGIRTMTLVAMGSAIFTIASVYGFRAEGTANDPARVAAQVATGVGFIGAGTIVLLGRTVRGLTTAAAIWVTAALGLAAGAGLLVLAIGGSLIATAALTFLPHSPSDAEIGVDDEDTPLQPQGSQLAEDDGDDPLQADG